MAANGSIQHWCNDCVSTVHLRNGVASAIDDAPITQTMNVASHDHYGTNSTILQIHDLMSETPRSGQPYQFFIASHLPITRWPMARA